TIVANNKSNPDLTNEVKVNSFGFKILAIFSKQKKQTIADQLKLQGYFSKLQEEIDISKDFSSSNFGSDINSKFNSLNVFKKEIIKIKNDFNNKSQKEF